MLKHRLQSASSGSLARSRASEAMGSTDTLTSTGSDSFTSVGSDTSAASSSGSSVTARKRKPKQRGVLKVYLGAVRSDMEYKCLPVTCEHTSREVVAQTLARCKMWGRDPNLYYLVMEIDIVAHDAAPNSGVAGSCRHVKELLPLSEDARPLELQHCQPSSRFYLHMKRGGLVKVHVSCISPGTQYKSLLVSPKTTCLEMARLLLKACKVSADVKPEHYAMHESCGHGADILYERRLSLDDCPLLIQQSWTNSEDFSFHLREVTAAEAATQSAPATAPPLTAAVQAPAPPPVQPRVVQRRRRAAHSMDVGDFLLCQQMDSVLDLCAAAAAASSAELHSSRGMPAGDCSDILAKHNNNNNNSSDANKNLMMANLMKGGGRSLHELSGFCPGSGGAGSGSTGQLRHRPAAHHRMPGAGRYGGSTMSVPGAGPGAAPSTAAVCPPEAIVHPSRNSCVYV